jgi:hypothetical protein
MEYMYVYSNYDKDPPKWREITSNKSVNFSDIYEKYKEKKLFLLKNNYPGLNYGHGIIFYDKEDLKFKTKKCYVFMYNSSTCKSTTCQAFDSLEFLKYNREVLKTVNYDYSFIPYFVEMNCEINYDIYPNDKKSIQREQNKRRKSILKTLYPDQLLWYNINNSNSS